MITAIEKLEALFYNESEPTINSNSWVIYERTLKKLILAAKEIEKEQIIQARIDGDENYSLVGGKRYEYAEQYYNQTYNQTNVGNDGFEFDNSSTIPPPKTNNQ